MSSMIDLATNEEITDADSFYENMNELGADLAETITALLNI
jgi:glutamate-1-semialdehyde aminotransferase